MSTESQRPDLVRVVDDHRRRLDVLERRLTRQPRPVILDRGADCPRAASRFSRNTTLMAAGHSDVVVWSFEDIPIGIATAAAQDLGGGSVGILTSGDFAVRVDYSVANGGTPASLYNGEVAVSPSGDDTEWWGMEILFTGPGGSGTIANLLTGWIPQAMVDTGSPLSLWRGIWDVGTWPLSAGDEIQLTTEGTPPGGAGISETIQMFVVKSC